MQSPHEHIRVIKTKIALAAWMIAAAFPVLVSPAWSAEDVPPAPASAEIPIDLDKAGRGGDLAARAVVRLLCPALNSASSGFLHKSGNIITSESAVHDCSFPAMVMADGKVSPVTVVAADQYRDLAIVKPSAPLDAKSLPIASGDTIRIGMQVATWGFPSGYFGLTPMLSVGYLAGTDLNQTGAGKPVKQWVVNGLFNGGNTGGPLIDTATGEVFGVITTKLAPLTIDTTAMLRALENSTAGPAYAGTTSDGKQVTVTEGQLVGRVVNELRRQVQLVVGKAVMRDDLIAFLKANNIEP
ncbi:MAG: serine protease [Bradyrhizobiaceae bacterium]|nr:MAG: serine protease [Bradyrhizobiaceae bacterium]